MGVMWPEAEKCQQPPNAGRGKGQILSWSLQLEGDPLTSQFQASDTDFGLLASKTLREFTSVVFGCQVCDDLSQQLQETSRPNIDNINHDV